MGRIHDALERAEQEREEQGGVPGGPAVPEELRADSVPDAKSSRRTELLRSVRRSKVMLTQSSSAVTDEYRTLRARIQSLRRTREIHTLVVTSARPGDGKSTTAANLAMSFGLERENRTCLIDCDLRTPTVHRSFAHLPDAGLAEILDADAKLEEGLIHVPDTRLWVLPVRALPANPSELLASTAMLNLLDDLRARFETIVIDSPPVLGLPDAMELVDRCDAALFVVHAGRTQQRDVEASLQTIDASKVIGTVLNRSTEVVRPYGYSRS